MAPTTYGVRPLAEKADDHIVASRAGARDIALAELLGILVHLNRRRERPGPPAMMY